MAPVQFAIADDVFPSMLNIDPPALSPIGKGKTGDQAGRPAIRPILRQPLDAGTIKVWHGPGLSTGFLGVSRFDRTFYGLNGTTTKDLFPLSLGVSFHAAMPLFW